MAQHKTESLRNVALVGHGSCGKTTLVEQILFKTAAVNRPGSVDDHNSHLDYEAEERDRGFSIDTAMARCAWKGCDFNFADTPGYPDFCGAALGALRAVETVAVVISAPAGIELNTRRMWAAADQAGKARILIINKMDAENINLDSLLGKIHEVFGSNCVPCNLPVGQGGDFKDVVNVLSLSGDAPAGLLGDAGSARAALTDAIVEADEALMERYLEDEAISLEEMTRALNKALVARSVVPIFFTSGRTGIGIEPLLDTLAASAPSPADVPSVAAVKKKGDEPVTLPADPNGPFVAQIFKIAIDAFVGKMAYLRVFSGTLDADASARNVRTGKNERVFQPMAMLGKEGVVLDKLVPGDIAAVGKMESAALNDALCVGPEDYELPALELPRPMVSLAVRPKSRNDEQRLGSGLEKLTDEDGTFLESRDTQTKELVISGISALHLDVLLARLKKRFGVEVETKTPNIPYLETVSAKAEAAHRHKKQTGGRGQFAEVHLRIEPLERGAGFEFADEVVGGVIPRQFIPAVEKGVRETLGEGVVAGYPIADVRVAVFFGKHHPVDSSEAAFKIAASVAFRHAFVDARPVLLEPHVVIEVTAPTQYMGEISGYLSSRRARIQGMEAAGDMQTIKAGVPLAEVALFATELRSMTAGTGFYSMEFSHYDIVPSHVAEQVIQKAKEAREKE